VIVAACILAVALTLGGAGFALGYFFGHRHGRASVRDELAPSTPRSEAFRDEPTRPG
jgi:hypothetical protein